MLHNREAIIDALRALGEHPEVAGMAQTTVVLAGRAAALLTNHAPGLAATQDCDVVAWPAGFSNSGRIEQCAQSIAGKLGLSPGWFNSDCYQSARWKLPADFQDRWEHVGRFGPMDIYCISRLDFIAMKFLATRDRDMADLRQLNPTAEERAWFEKRLDEIEAQYPREKFTIAIARARLKDLNESDV